MTCVSDFLNGPMGTNDPIIIKSVKLIHIHIKYVHVVFHRGKKIYKPIIFAKHIF